MTDYNSGYKDGMTGNPRMPPGDLWRAEQYDDGWFDGESDRPMMDDFVDPAMERDDPFGY